MFYMKKKIVLIVTFSIAFVSFANIRLPSILNSNMVLQQQSAVKLLGWSSPAEKIFVTTSWNNNTDSKIGTGDAKW